MAYGFLLAGSRRLLGGAMIAWVRSRRVAPFPSYLL